ncbi:hypothetical protein PR202_gb14158 [Eleusine coracana subsp. coracana]|uniref:Clu domain-containing protein n=1 Tax=Eleusine coracana subsp. coracana TaxID=191504 RepID=A0AAV5EUB4_ELECO|nr:hypothetical protein PR202_gb14158 [Eleusine coracana subsp. coracana]
MQDYTTEEQAVAHVRRLLDIVACTTAFAKPRDGAAKHKSSKHGRPATPPSPPAPASAGAHGGAGSGEAPPPISEAHDMAAIRPPPKLGEFYDFFSFANLTPPFHFIRRKETSGTSKEGDYFEIEVKVCNGKLLHIVASVKGFYLAGKPHTVSYSLVDLLQQLSNAFANAYKALMKAFVDRNKFGNLPYGFRANTWLIPPVYLDSAIKSPALPVEDESWGGDGGGSGRDGKYDRRRWAKEFSILARMPCKTDEERVIRDRKAFLLHNLFVDTAIFRAASTIRGLTATVKVSGRTKDSNDGKRNSDISDNFDGTFNLDVPDQPDGGSNALNVNSLRIPLPKLSNPEISVGNSTPKTHADNPSRKLARTILEDSLKKDSPVSENGKGNAGKVEKEPAVRGLGKHFEQLRKIKKKESSTEVSRSEKEESNNNCPSVNGMHDADKIELGETHKVSDISKLMSEDAFSRLKSLGADLHEKSLVELTKMAHDFYDDTALPKLVADFASLELSPVDGRTMTDFMHTRGLNMCSLGHVVGVTLRITVGLELVARDYDMNSPNPFDKSDIVSIVPHVVYSSIDGRNLLESSKMALDKGKLDDAVSYGTKATIYQQKALDINERELGLDHPETMKSYGDLSVFYYRLQHIEMALKYVNRALYLLQFSCGLSHPNSAATYINVAMMEEGMGNVHVALRYLHEALKCNKRLLGADHIQILQEKLGQDDLRTQDAAAWLEYFESKALEQQEAARRGMPKPDSSIANLLDFISPDLERKEKDMQKKGRRAKNNVRAQHVELVEEKEENVQHDLGSSPEPSNDSLEELKLDAHPPVVSEENYAVHDEQKQSDVLSPEEYSDEGWQAATLRGRSANVKKKISRRKPALTKLFVDRFEDSHTASARTGSQPQTKGGKEDTVSAPSQLSFGSFLKTDKLNGDPSIVESGNATAKPDRVAKPAGTNRPASIASKFVSYKDVAVSPPGTILKPILEQKEAKDMDNGHDTDLTLSSGEEDRFTEKDKEKPSVDSSKEPLSSSDGDGVRDVETAPDSNSDESPSAPKKTPGSKLSASAPPFNPGSLLSMSHPYSTVAIYDASAVLQPIPSQAMEILPHAVDTRVPRGPRSTLYYRTGHAFQRKQGYTTHSQSSILRGNNPSTTMNPHAAEFVPGKTSQQSDAANKEPSRANAVTDDSAQVVTSLTADAVKAETPAEEKPGQVEKVISGKGKESRGKDVTRNSYKTELARQILLSFIVKSVHDSLGSTRAESDRKPSGSDEASIEQSSTIRKNAAERAELDKQQKATEAPKEFLPPFDSSAVAVADQTTDTSRGLVDS